MERYPRIEKVLSRSLGAGSLRANKIDLNVHRRKAMPFDPVDGERHWNRVPLHGPTQCDGYAHLDTGHLPLTWGSFLLPVIDRHPG
jgi:hypothetical protein